jgi:hypothetical protein
MNRFSTVRCRSVKSQHQNPTFGRYGRAVGISSPNQTSALMKSEKIMNQNMVNTKAAGYTLSRGLWGQQRTNASGLILACFRLSNAYASVSPILANWGSGTRSGLAAKSSSPLLVVGSAMFACRHICPFLRRASIILSRTASDGTMNYGNWNREARPSNPSV